MVGVMDPHGHSELTHGHEPDHGHGSDHGHASDHGHGHEPDHGHAGHGHADVANGNGGRSSRRGSLIVLAASALAGSFAITLLITALMSRPERAPVRPVAAPQQAVALPPDANLYIGSFTSEGKQIPLPPGEWMVMGRAISSIGPMTDKVRAPVVSTTLVRLQGRRVDAAILLQVTPLAADSLWGLAAGCQRKDFYATRILYSSDHDAACDYVTYVTPWSSNSPAIDRSWHEATEQAVDNSWGVPPGWLAVVYRIADPMDAMQVRYLFDPSPGSASKRQITPDELASIMAWSDAGWPAVQRGFRNRLAQGEESALPAWLPQVKWSGPAGFARSVQPVDPAAVRSLTTRAAVTLGNFAVSYAYLGSVAGATTLSLLQSSVGNVITLIQDAAWNYEDPPLAGVPVLPGAGLEQPGPTGTD